MATCEKCSTVLSASNLDGFCPRCLIADGLEPIATDRELPILSGPFHQRFIGDFELLEEVARGGMGVVYKARQRSLGRTVALKVLSSGEFASPEFVARFRTEAAAAARLQHPNIVSIHQVGEHDGIQYFTMDLVEGPNLSEMMQGRTLPPDRAAAYLKSLAEAVQHAHQQGILHRDLKPSNVLVDPFGEPRLTDFGLAKELSGSSEITVTGQVLGTPGYLSPEQTDSSCGPLTPASDIYSLGALLYYMVTGRAPFVAGSLSELLRQMMSSDPVVPRLLNPEVPGDLETICLKCLEREPSRRYESAGQLSDDLARFLAREPILARPMSAAGRFSRWCRRRPALAAAWLLAVALAVGSTVSTIVIARAWRHAGAALAQARSAEAAGRERLREARLAEARAIRRTTLPGRREKALKALAEAAQVRSGEDLRDEALAALLLTDVKPRELWDPKLGVPMDIALDPRGTVASLRFIDSGGYINGQPTVRRWGEAQPAGALDLSGATNSLGPLRFSLDGKLVMSRLDGHRLRIWTVADGQTVVTVTDRPNPGGEMITQAFNDDYAFTPDGAQFVLGVPSGGLSLHRLDGGNEIAHWASTGLITTVRMAPDGRHVAATSIASYDQKKVEIIEVPNMQRLRTLNEAASINGLAWASDGSTVAVMTSENNMAIHEITSGRLIKNIICPGTGPGEFSYIGQDQLLAVRGRGTTLRIINIGNGLEDLVIDGYGPSSLASEAGGNSILIPNMAGVVTRYDCQLPVGCRTLSAPAPDGVEMANNSCCLDFTPDGKWMVTSHGRYAFVRDTKTGRVVEVFDSGPPHGVEISSVAFCDNGRKLLRYSTRTGLHQHEVHFDSMSLPHIGPGKTLQVEPGWILSDRTADARRLFVVEPRTERVRVLDVDADADRIQTVGEWSVPGIYSGAFDPTGEQVLVNCGGVGTNLAALRLRVHSSRGGQVLHQLSAPISCDVAWSADGRVALTSNGEDRSILWDTRVWAQIAVLNGAMGGPMTTFAISPRNDFAVITRDDVVFLVALDGRIQARFQLIGATGLAAGIRFLPDQRQFAILWRDGRVDIIDPERLRAELGRIGLAW